jgi:signal transduction histidine kinase
MNQLSLHILDIVQNSIKAKATLIEIIVDEHPEKDIYSIEIIDNGSGIEQEFLKTIDNPFTTTQSTRKVGLGIPLLKQNAEQAGGSFEIKSEPGKGTRLKAVFMHSHIDRPIMGDIAGTMTILIASEMHIRFIYRHSTPLSDFEFDTDEVKKELEGTPLNHPDIIKALKCLINENLLMIEATLS